jgi:hypothetical protein
VPAGTSPAVNVAKLNNGKFVSTPVVTAVFTFLNCVPVVDDSTHLNGGFFVEPTSPVPLYVNVAGSTVFPTKKLCTL